jgi:hypothetical protein
LRRLVLAVLSILGGVPPADLSPRTTRRLATTFVVLCGAATALFLVALLLYAVS